MVIERILHNVHHEKMKWDYRMLSCNFYYGHWEPNGDEGWRMRTKDYGDCGKFGGFDYDESYYKNIQCTDCLFLEDIENLIVEEVGNVTFELDRVTVTTTRLTKSSDYIVLSMPFVVNVVGVKRG